MVLLLKCRFHICSLSLPLNVLNFVVNRAPFSLGRWGFFFIPLWGAGKFKNKTSHQHESGTKGVLMSSRFRKHSFSRKECKRKAGKGIPLSSLMEDHRPRGGAPPHLKLGGNSETFLLAPCFCVEASWVCSNLFLISPSTKESHCEWPLSRRSFEELAKQWALCHPRGWRGQEVTAVRVPLPSVPRTEVVS